MKHVVTISAVAFLAIWTFSSCQKETASSVTNSGTLSYAMSSDTSLSLFNLAVVTANDQQLFTSTDSVTVLAPTNDAFAAVGITAGTITGLSSTALDALIRYHYVPAAVNVTSGYSSYTSLLGPVLYGTTDGTTIYFNGSTGVKQDAVTGNATLYKLNSLLQVPATSLSALLAADTSLTLFAEALQRTGLGATAGTNGWTTILAPDNNAFAIAGYPDIASIDNADINVLNNITGYHILSGQYFTNDFIKQVTITAEEGNAINITSVNGIPQFTGNGNVSAATITIGNKLAGSTVIVHKIDHVLLP